MKAYLSEDFIALSEIREYLSHQYSITFPDLEILQMVFKLLVEERHC